MPMRFKIDILSALKQKGFTTYKIRKDGVLSGSTLQKLRNGEPLSWDNIETICRLLSCQPGDIMEYVEEAPEG